MRTALDPNCQWFAYPLFGRIPNQHFIQSKNELMISTWGVPTRVNGRVKDFTILMTIDWGSKKEGENSLSILQCMLWGHQPTHMTWMRSGGISSQTKCWSRWTLVGVVFFDSRQEAGSRGRGKGKANIWLTSSPRPPGTRKRVPMVRQKNPTENHQVRLGCTAVVVASKIRKLDSLVSHSWVALQQ